jgi:hypothetical protein
MVIYLSDRVRECWFHAKACGHIAAAEGDAEVQQSYFDAGARWLKLALRLAEATDPKFANRCGHHLLQGCPLSIRAQRVTKSVNPHDAYHFC